MKKLAFQFMAATAIVIGFVVILGVAGNADLCDQVILSMSQEQYDSVKNHLKTINGDAPSDREIANWWIEHHKE